jgi:Protein of unknown function (DUF3160)
MSVADLEKELAIQPAKDPPLSFDPTSIRYFKEVVDRLQLTREEQSILRSQGVVSVDHVQRYSMASSYHAIYTRDLPVLITTDSILHALHRSYDEILKELEVRLFSETIRRTLTATVTPLERKSQAYKDDRLWESARDVDVYVTVALNLLEGGGAEGAPAELAIRSKLPDDDPRVEEQLRNIDSLNLREANINGSTAKVDFTQFRPRGHYTESKELQRYFRTLMWLGRADLGFVVTPPKDESTPASDADRGLRDAALLTMLVDDSGSRQALDAMSGVIDFLVGRADNLRLDQMSSALASTGIKNALKLADGRALATLRKAVAGLGDQQIRSQALTAEREGKETMPPSVFQLFGQRFLIDSFVLSKVVFDSIQYKGEQPNRQMPSGRDVMAALGNNEAVRLLEPELEQYKYSTNLYSARKLIDGYSKEEWQKSVYGLWLDTLRTLDDTPSGHFPEAMRREAWRRKHLETQLASWAELRHDTILYGKQSYSSAACEYPEGYVEPYPNFFSKLRELSDQAGQKIGSMDVAFGPKLETTAKNLRDGYVAFFQRFGETMELLELLARKELAAKPFSTDETWFLKRTIDVSGGGSGPPRYDGWYPRLLYGGDPMKYKPVVADVHSAPNDGTVLQEAVGDVNFLVVAVDNEKDRALYVGPAYSYYEFAGTMNDRLTDETWQAMIEQGRLPPRPAWTNVFRGKPVARTLPPGNDDTWGKDPRVDAIVKDVSGKLKKNPSIEDRRRAGQELERRLEELGRTPLPSKPRKKK